MSSVAWMFAVVLAAGLAARVQAAAPDAGQPTDNAALRERAVAQSLEPIRPGEPGKTPFWNGAAKMFTYAPAFEFGPVQGAARYRFTVKAADASEHTFLAAQPWAALRPIWRDLPVGSAALTVTAVGADGKDLRVAGTRTFYRAAVFAGPYGHPTMDYRTSARTALKALFGLPAVQHWRETGQPDPRYALYCYPSKMVAAIIDGMLAYRQLTDDEGERAAALAIARAAADWLIGASEPAGAPLEFWPPTYRGDQAAAKSYRGQIMVIYPAGVGQSYLRLHEACGDRKYFEAAERIARTYKKTQNSQGTWTLKVRAQDGGAVKDVPTVPLRIALFLEQLAACDGMAEYRPVAGRAMRWMFENPMKTFCWNGQFEDVDPRDGYRNLSRGEAGTFAVWLLARAADDARYRPWAEEILRFCEDQFVVWEQPMNPKWFTPSALEQYAYYVAIDASIASMIRGFAAAWKATGDDLYRAKAVSLANTLVIVQQGTPNRLYPTVLAEGQCRWLNCAETAAESLLELDAALSAGVRK